MKRRVMGHEHPSTLVSMNNLAALYKTQGKYDLAEPLYVEYSTYSGSAWSYWPMSWYNRAREAIKSHWSRSSPSASATALRRRPSIQSASTCSTARSMREKPGPAMIAPKMLALSSSP